MEWEGGWGVASPGGERSETPGDADLGLLPGLPT